MNRIPSPFRSVFRRATAPGRRLRSTQTNQQQPPPEQPPAPVSTDVALSVLTNGIGDRYVPFFRDYRALQNKSYSGLNFCPFGVNMPNNGPNPHSNQAKVEELIGKGIRGVRYEVQWGIVERSLSQYSWNEYNIDGDISWLTDNGATVQIETGYTPGFRTGQRYRVYPPLIAVNTPEPVNFSGGDTATLPHSLLFLEKRKERNTTDGNKFRETFYLMPENAATTEVTNYEYCKFYRVDENNRITSRDENAGWQDTFCAYTSKFPIDVSSLIVEVETSNGWERFYVVDKIDSNSTGKVCYADYTGRIAFKDSRMPSGGLAPAEGARVRVRYKYYNTYYDKDISYTLDKMTGVIRRGRAGFSVPEMSNDFSSGFGPSWGWLTDSRTPPSTISDSFNGESLDPAWTVNGAATVTVSGGKLTVNAPSGTETEITRAVDDGSDGGSADFLMSVDLSGVTLPSGGLVGLVIKMTNNRYVRGYIRRSTSNALAVALQKFDNGQTTTSTDKAFNLSTADTRIFIKREGSTFKCWVGTYHDDNSPAEGSFNTDVTVSSVGLYIKGGNTQASFDNFRYMNKNQLDSISVSNGRVVSNVYAGASASWVQPVINNGFADFTAELKVDLSGLGSNQKGCSAGIVLYQDENNFVKVLMRSFSSAERKLVLITKIDGTLTETVDYFIGSSSAFYITVTRTGSSFRFKSESQSYRRNQSEGYSREVTQEIEGFTVNRIGICWEHRVNKAPGTVYLDDWSVTGAIQVSDTCKALYHYVDLQAIQNFAYNLVNHFKNRVKYYEYGNEIAENPKWTWAAGIATYAKCLEAFSNGAKAADPQAKILNAGWADSEIDLHSELYNSGISKSVWDVTACHPYWFRKDYPGSRFEEVINNIINRMNSNQDGSKMVFAGEFSVPNAALVSSTGKRDIDGPNERKQAEYAFHALCKIFRTGRYQAVQWWPGQDLHYHPDGEANLWGGHDGLFTRPREENETALAKPVLHIISEMAKCRGIIIDLVGYEGNTPNPVSRKHKLGYIKIKLKNIENLNTVVIEKSLTAWPENSTVKRVCAAEVWSDKVFAVEINGVDSNGFVPTTSSLINEKVFLTWDSSTLQWDVTSNVRGALGSVEPNRVFNDPASPSAWYFTAPAAPTEDPYTKYYSFETVRGDGWSQVGGWANSNPRLRGEKEIMIPLLSEDARYLKIHMTFDNFIQIAQISVFNDNDENISIGKLYYADGFKP